MDSIFRHIDNNKTGVIKLTELTESLDKLHSPEISSLHELRVPESSDVERAYKTLESVTLSGQITHAEFLTVMFRTTTESDD
jgi:Ca2+-binding EF-hand superfamily protein